MNSGLVRLGREYFYQCDSGLYSVLNATVFTCLFVSAIKMPLTKTVKKKKKQYPTVPCRSSCARCAGGREVERKV